jgi:hypothetical protein
VANAEWPLLAGSACSALLLLPERKHATRTNIEQWFQLSKVTKSSLSRHIGFTDYCIYPANSTMAKKKKKSPSAVQLVQTVITTPSVSDTTVSAGQPADINVHTREELVLPDNPPTIPGANADEAAVEAGKTSKVEIS